MSQYRLYVHEKGLFEGAPERGIYENPQGWKYLRGIKEGGKESFLPCGTESVTEAIKLRDARSTSKAAAGLGIAVSPDEAAKTAATTIPMVILRYQADKYPDKKGRSRKAGWHLNAEMGYCKTLLKYFNGDAPAANLNQNDLDDYHKWRVEQVKLGKEKLDVTRAKPHGEGRRTTHCVRQATLAQLEARLRDFLPAPLLSAEDQGPNSRDRVFSLRLTFECFLWQLLKPQTSCREVARQVQALFRLHGRGHVDEGDSAYVQARLRLPKERLEKALVATAQAADRRAGSGGQLHGRPVKVVDASTAQLADNRDATRDYLDRPGHRSHARKTLKGHVKAAHQ
jgi:hypothetical protein